MSVPFCHSHHWSGHGSSGGSADPVMEAFAVTIFVVAGISVLLSLLSGGLLIAFTRRVRDMFWAIPAINVAAYGVFLLVRQYPGGFAAQFQGWELVYTLVALVMLLVASLVLASLLALTRVVVRRMRSSAHRRAQPGSPPADGRDAARLD